MALSPINPTQLTPPRVDLIDPRSGAISREWYRFFLSLLTAVQTSQEEVELAPDATSLIASYDAMLETLAQATESAPDCCSATASLESELNDLSQTVLTQPRDELGTMAALQQANVPWLTFNNAPVPVPTAIGSVYWNGGTTLNVQMTPNVIQRVGEDLFYYIKASATITKGQVIMFDGAVGASGVLKGKPATGVTSGYYIMGIAAESIANNDFGLVQINGPLKGIDTSMFADGDVLWYDPTVVGGLTATVPAAPNVKVEMAAVARASNNGVILIRVTAGSALGETDNNVQFTGLADADIIEYNAAAGYWENTPATAVQVVSWLGL